MKAIIFALSCAALLRGLNASSFEENFAEENKDIFEQWYNVLNGAQNDEVTMFPGWTTKITLPPIILTSTTTKAPTTTTTQATTTTTQPTTTTTQPTTTVSTTTTTTQRTTPGVPTKRPIPPPIYPPGLRNPQIYRNIFDVQGPFAAKLNNIVQNQNGRQSVEQKNSILYNFRLSKALKRMVDED